MALRMLHVSKCKPGQVLGRAIVDDEGATLVGQNASLTQDVLADLAAAGHTNLVLDVDDSFASEQEHIDEAWVATGLKALADRGVPPQDQLASLQRQAGTDLNGVYRLPAVEALFGNRENVRGTITRTIVSEFKAKPLAALIEIKTFDAALYVHALTATVAAALIARAVGVPQHRTGQLLAGTLLQDIGLICLPKDMSDANRHRLHPLVGYRLLRESGYVEALSAHVALEHHECTDGTGEPRGVIGQNSLNVSRFALPPLPTLVGEISAVANMYAAKTGKGPGGGQSPDQAVVVLRNAAGVKLNKAVVVAFLQATPIFPAGVSIVMRGGEQDGFRGRVCAVNPSCLDRPTVTLMRDRKNAAIQPTNVDLSNEKGLRLEVRAW